MLAIGITIIIWKVMVVTTGTGNARSNAQSSCERPTKIAQANYVNDTYQCISRFRWPITSNWRTMTTNTMQRQQWCDEGNVHETQDMETEIKRQIDRRDRQTEKENKWGREKIETEQIVSAVIHKLFNLCNESVRFYFNLILSLLRRHTDRAA